MPAARVGSTDESVEHALATGRRLIQKVRRESSPDRELNLPVAAFSFAQDGPDIEWGPPRFGQHTDEVLAEYGFNTEEMADLRESRVV